jgi:hypothetical protein
MAIQVTATEYLTLDSVPLMTPAWFCDDFSELLNGPGVRGGDITAGSRPGQIARRRTLDARQASLSFVIYGDRDAEGNLNADVRAGLIENIDALKALLTPNLATLQGTRTLTVVAGGVTRAAAVHVSPDIQLASLGPAAARATVLVTIPEGVFRDAGTVTHSFTGTGSKTLTLNGTGSVLDAVVKVTADCDSFTLSNTTLGVSLSFGAPLSTWVQLYCGTFSALRSDSVNVTGYVTTTATPFWLPLAPGVNALTFSVVGATGTPALEVVTRGVWL